jgi:Ca2+-binding EF-hand superfamily protein
LCESFCVPQYKAQGNEAYEAGKLDEAIAAYTKAIKLDESNHVYYSNRSAAHLKKGEASLALDDAESCLELSSGEFAKGYSRKAGALQAMKRYKEAAEVLKVGLDKFPGEEQLAVELENVVKEQKVVSSSRARRASVIASQSTKKKATEAESVSDFVKLSRFALEFEIAAMQAQLMILNSLAERTDEEKLKMLFGILDKDGDGFIDAVELSDGIRKHRDSFSFADSLDRAMDMVAVFDTDHDAKLNISEFQKYIETMLEEMGATFHELSEFIIMQMLFSEGNDAAEELAGAIVSLVVDEEVKTRGEFYNALVDKRMIALFQLFDLDHDGQVDFVEVALGLYKLTDDMEGSTTAAVGILLTFDEDESRSLDYVQFSKLIMNIAASSDEKFEDIADALTLQMCKGVQVLTTEDLACLAVLDELYNAALDEADAQREAIEAIGALQYSKLHKLFDLWDADHDGFIQFDELVVGMRKFQEAMDIEESVQAAALVMIGFDANGDQKLDRIEFSIAMTNFAKVIEVDSHDLIDFMCVVSALADDDETEKAFLYSIAPQITKQIASIQNNLLLEGP